MSSDIVSLGFLVSQNCTLKDFLPGADTMASHSKCMLMRSGHVLKRILVSDFLSPMESQIAFGSADIEAMEGEAFMPNSNATSVSTIPERRPQTPVAGDSACSWPRAPARWNPTNHGSFGGHDASRHNRFPAVTKTVFQVSRSKRYWSTASSTD